MVARVRPIESGEATDGSKNRIRRGSRLVDMLRVWTIRFVRTALRCDKARVRERKAVLVKAVCGPASWPCCSEKKESFVRVPILLEEEIVF